MNAQFLPGSSQSTFLQGRLLIWFSCGAASAVAAKLAIATHKGPEPIEVLRMPIANEHEDNDRFAADVSQWLGHPIKELRSKEFPSMDIYDVFEKKRFIAGTQGASCTKALKRDVREAYQQPEDTHVFGYTLEEAKRIEGFEHRNPSLRVLWILRDLGITKPYCFRVLEDAGIKRPAMYRLGHRNNNCRVCVKGGMGYINHCREVFPEDVKRMEDIQRRLGVRPFQYRGERIYMDEIPPGAGRYDEEPDISCGPQCTLPDPQMIDLLAP
jgi:hypothetical protein